MTVGIHEWLEWDQLTVGLHAWLKWDPLTVGIHEWLEWDQLTVGLHAWLKWDPLTVGIHPWLEGEPNSLPCDRVRQRVARRGSMRSKSRQLSCPPFCRKSIPAPVRPDSTC